MIKGYKIQIYPNKEQAKDIINFCNASRFAYNWALQFEQEFYQMNHKYFE